MVTNIKHKKVLLVFLLISFVELVVSIMINLESRHEKNPQCNFMLMQRANAYLVVKEFVLLLLGAAIFLFSSLRAPWKLWHMNKHRVYLMVTPGVVDLRIHFRNLMRECIIGFVVCLAFTARIHIFTYYDGKYEQNYENSVLTTFIVQYVAVSCYRV